MSMFQTKNQKNIIIIAIIFLVLIGVAVYFSIKNHQKKSTTTITTQANQVSTEPMLFPSISLDGTKINFYSNTRDLAFYQEDLDGSNVTKISGILDQPDNVIWSPDAKNAILKLTYDQYKFEKFNSPFSLPGTADQTETTWLYNFTSQKLTHISNKIGNVIWQNNNQIVYQQKDAGSSSLNLSDATGQNSQKIVDLPSTQDFGFSFLSKDQIVVYNSPSDVSATTIYTLNLTGKKLVEIKKTDSPSVAMGLSDNQILTSTQTNNNIKDSILNTDGSTNRDLKVQCSLDNFIDLSSNHIILTAQTNNLNNQFILLNTQTGESSTIKVANDINAENLFVSPDKKTLYFTSNNLLNKITIPDLK